MFKKCSGCKQHWATREEFISDPLVRLVGYQVNFGDLEAGFFLFNHLNPKCKTTLSIHTGIFSDLYHGVIFQERQEGSAKCPGHCLHMGNLNSCPAKCECNYVREVMQIIVKHPKI